jgi:hypothetical protein
MAEAVKVHSYLDRDAIQVTLDLKRDPDEHEFYVLVVGKAVTELLIVAAHLEHSPAYLSAFPNSGQFRREVSRVDYVGYTFENFLFRTQSIFDRTLQLVAGTFHLLLDKRDCSENAVVRNLRVERTNVPKAVKSIRKITDRYRDSRNEIVHRESFKDQALRKAKLYHLAESFDDLSPLLRGNTKVGSAKHLRDFVAEHKKQIAAFNGELFPKVENLLVELEPAYDEQRERLRKLCGEVGA